MYQTRCENQVILASHGGLTTLWEQQLRKPKYDLCVPVTETLFTGIDNECMSEGTRFQSFMIVVVGADGVYSFENSG